MRDDHVREISLKRHSLWQFRPKFDLLSSSSHRLAYQVLECALLVVAVLRLLTQRAQTLALRGKGGEKSAPMETTNGDIPSVVKEDLTDISAGGRDT